MVTILIICEAKTGNNAAGLRKLQKPGFNRPVLNLFVTVSFYIKKTVTI
jgi:hypothetical protein